MTEAIAATPGWVEERLDTIFASLPAESKPARDVFAACLAGSKAPAAPSDLLGAEFEPCHAALHRALMGCGIDKTALDAVMAEIETLEAEIAEHS